MDMLVSIIFLLILLALINRLMSGSALYPPVLFSLAWAGFLLLLYLSKDLFYSVSIDAAFFFFLGAFALSIGGMAVLLFVRCMPHSSVHYVNHGLARKALQWFVAVLIIGLPFFIYDRIQLSAASGIADFWVGLRHQLLVNAETVQRSFSILNNLVALAIITAAIAFYEMDDTRKSKVMAILSGILGLVYNLFNAQRYGAMSLVLCLAGIYLIKRRRVKLKYLCLMTALLIAIFSSMAVYLQKGEAKESSEILDNIVSVENNFLLYALGGIVGFSKIMENPALINANWHISRFFLVAAKKFGFDVDIPILHADWMMISPKLGYTNVYTMYFAYFPAYGWFGAMSIMLLLGMIFTAVFYFANKCNPHATILYGFILSGISLSSFNEQFFMNLNILIKTIIVTTCLYQIPRLLQAHHRKQNTLC